LLTVKEKKYFFPAVIKGKMTGRKAVFLNISGHLLNMYKLHFYFILLCCPALYSCSDKYMAYKNQYSFKSETGKPDYSDLNYWAAHPWKKDPSDSIPKPLYGEIRDSTADLFFLYPTSLTKRTGIRTKNAAIDDSYINAKTDYSSILYQASVFNEHARIFSPRYRQANIAVFFDKNTEQADSIFEIAYSDIKEAFQYYLSHYNKGRPIIIAAHSQGSKMANRLLKEFFDESNNKAQAQLQDQLVVAYILGWPVPKEYFSSLKMCVDSVQTGCICSWRTVRRNYLPYYLKSEKGNSFVTNPLTWTTDSAYASKRLNSGSVLFKFNKLYKHTTDAQISNGLLWVKKPKFPWSFLYFTKNYHAGDINLFYINIRENVEKRIDHFLRK
jgi:Protein of unknown function (DUF3089)